MSWTPLHHSPSKHPWRSLGHREFRRVLVFSYSQRRAWPCSGISVTRSALPMPSFTLTPRAHSFLGPTPPSANQPLLRWPPFCQPPHSTSESRSTSFRIASHAVLPEDHRMARATLHLRGYVASGGPAFVTDVFSEPHFAGHHFNGAALHLCWPHLLLANRFGQILLGNGR
jgi:hypothetical protein